MLLHCRRLGRVEFVCGAHSAAEKSNCKLIYVVRLLGA